MSQDNISLTDYILERAYSKNDSYTRTEINNLLEIIENKDLDLFEIVDTLPTTNIRPKLYLIYNNLEDNTDLFDVYINVNDNWERIDSFNLGDYYTSNQLDNLLVNKASVSDLRIVRTNLETTITNLNNLYNNLIEFNKGLSNNDDYGNDLSKLKDNLLDLISRITALITNVDTKIDNTQSEVNTLQSSITELNTELNTGLNEIDERLDNTNQILTNTNGTVALLDNKITSGLEQLNNKIDNGDIIDNTKYDIDLNIDFGVRGINDTIIIDMDIVNYQVTKTINTNGD